MFSMGCIIYIMLTGRHPFDVSGHSTDEEMEERIKHQAPPLRGSRYTADLSDSALDLIERLLDKRPERRMTAMEMLRHPWVQGTTASKTKIQDSDKRLKVRRAGRRHVLPVLPPNPLSPRRRRVSRNSNPVSS